MRNRRASRRRPSGLALAIALAATGVAGCSSGTEITVGDVEATNAASGPVDGHRVSVVVPTGRLDVVVAEPRAEVGDQEAADDGRLVRLTTTFRDAEVRGDVWAFAAREGMAEPVTLALEVDGDRYNVGVVRRGSDADADLAPDDAVVAVPDDTDADEIRLIVGYDGLEQSVSADDGSREPGVADALYEQAERGPSTSCANGSFRPALPAEGRCRVGEARRVPYLPQLGWAEEGRSWLVVSLGTEVSGIRAGTARYVVDAVTDRTTYQGEPAAATIDERQDAGTWSAQLVFAAAESADPSRIRIALDFRLRLVDGTPPAQGGPERLRYVDDVTLPD